jgi:hypothetical protein
VADATMTIGRVQVHRRRATDAAHLNALVDGYGEHMGPTIESVASFAERVTAS